MPIGASLRNAIRSASKSLSYKGTPPKVSYKAGSNSVNIQNYPDIKGSFKERGKSLLNSASSKIPSRKEVKDYLVSAKDRAKDSLISSKDEAKRYFKEDFKGDLKENLGEAANSLGSTFGSGLMYSIPSMTSSIQSSLNNPVQQSSPIQQDDPVQQINTVKKKSQKQNNDADDTDDEYDKMVSGNYHGGRINKYARGGRIDGCARRGLTKGKLL